MSIAEVEHGAGTQPGSPPAVAFGAVSVAFRVVGGASYPAVAETSLAVAAHEFVAIGGSTHVVTGAYEHTIRMQVKGQDILAVIELGRYPGIALAVKKDRADKIKTVADLKGAKIGVTAPGSSTNMIVWYLMAKAGLKPDDAAFVGVGTGPSAIAAMQRGEIDAISNIDPVIAKLQSTGDIEVLAETRTTEGTTKAAAQ